MRVLSKLALMGALAAICGGGTAAATTYTATATGIISGTDTAGVFGPAGDNLDGASFTAVFTYNPALFGSATRSTPPGVDDQVIGGSVYGTPNPILTDSITINGVSVSMDASQFSELLASGPAYGDGPELFQGIIDITDGFEIAVAFRVPTLNIIPSLTATQSYSSSYDYDNLVSGVLSYGGDSLTLYSTAADISTSAPEPDSLTLTATAAMLLGFLARRRSA